MLYRRKDRIIVHHSAGPRSQTADEIKAFVLSRADLGGKKAYAKIIERDGSVHDFADEHDIQVAHAVGFNRRGIGICVVGWFDLGHDTIDRIHPQFRSLTQTCAILCRRHRIQPGSIIGHQDTFRLRGRQIEKSCPGEILWRLLPDLRAQVAGYLT